MPPLSEHLLEALVAETEADDVSDAPRIPSSPDELFRCEPLACTLRGAVCVQRQTQELKARNPGAQAKKAFKYSFCGSGKCEQGKAIAAALEGKVASAPQLLAGGHGELQRADHGGRNLEQLVRAQKSVNRTVPRPQDPPSSPVPKPAPIPTTTPPAPARPEHPQHQEHNVASNPNRPRCGHPGCTVKINANNKLQRCKAHRNAAYAARAAASPATKAPAKTKPQQELFSPGPPELDLPSPSTLPDGYLVACVNELKARAVRMYRAARGLGFDPAAAAEPDHG